jgi:RHS repeat-associated protein
MCGRHIAGDQAYSIVENGLVIQYYPFGVRRNSQGTLDTDKLFTGQRLDDTGLYFYNARYYDATIGRFISADPVVPDYTNPQSLNRYAYCLNNPLKYIDPTGHSWWSNLVNIIKVVITAVVDTITGGDSSGSSSSSSSSSSGSGSSGGSSGGDGTAGGTGTETSVTILGGLAVSGADDTPIGWIASAGVCVYLGYQYHDKIGEVVSGIVDKVSSWCNNLWSSSSDDGTTVDKSGAQDKRLTSGEIKRLQQGGENIEEIKGAKGAGQRDLFKDKDGNIVVKPADGSGPGEYTGLNINDY